MLRAPLGPGLEQEGDNVEQALAIDQTNLMCR